MPRTPQSGTETTSFPSTSVLKMGSLGLMGLPFDEAYGGSGGDFASVCVAIEEIGRVDQSVGLTLEARGRAWRQSHPRVRYRGAETRVAP